VASDHVSKILRSLPARWRPKVTAIEEVKDLNTLSVEDLISSLKVHEIGLNELEFVKKSNSIALSSKGKTSKALLSYVVNHGIILYQMDVKSAFLNGVITEEVYVKPPSGFEDLKYLDHVYKLKKSLYGLKQAPKAWYDRLSNFLIENDFKRDQVDTTLFRTILEKDILVVHIYVDDIIFGSNNSSLCKEFFKLM